MIKHLLIDLLLIYSFLNNLNSFKLDGYLSAIEEISKNATLLGEYFKWSSKLFSDPDYLYGPKAGPFSCAVHSEEPRNEPITVHTLRPSDVQCVAAIGDSLTAGLGAHAITPLGLFYEMRGVSWSIGGDKTYDEVITLPNILRQYNPNLKGFSTKSSVIFLKGQNSSHNGLNVAKSGDRSYHTVDQAKILYERLLTNEYCDLQNDWKVITLFIGGNDLCIFCEDPYRHSPLMYTTYVNNTLSYLYENFPKTFVNLVLVLNVSNVAKLNDGGTICQLFHKKTCSCAAYPTEKDQEILKSSIPLYHQYLIDLVDSGIYDGRDDFTVVVQPFMANTQLPTKDGDTDYSYFAPDCFHFSGKGHSRAALSLWNNMLEPIEEKKREWHDGEQLECPTKERPYFATRFNSPKKFGKIPPRK